MNQLTISGKKMSVLGSYLVRGFTLIELMITMAIIAILTSIALPAYTTYVQRGWRADARAVLLDNAQFLARFYTQNLAYVDGAGNPPTMPATTAPRQGTVRYNLAVVATAAVAGGAASSYTLTAVPTDWVDTTCGTLGINQVGRRGTIDSAGQLVDNAECWTR